MDQKVIIAYPCRWQYRVIGADETAMRAAIADVTAGAGEISVTRHSQGGRYVSLNVAVQVENEQRRIAIYEALLKDPSVKVVL